MNCPICKDVELLPARLSENSIKPDGLKCKKCLGTWVMDGSNHLKRVDGKQDPPAAAVLVEEKKTEVKQEDLTPTEKEKVAVIKKSLAPLKTKFESEEDKAEAWRRLVSGDRPSVIAREMGYELHVINNYKQNNRKKLESQVSSKEMKEKKPAPAAGVVEKKAQYSYQERLDIVRGYRSGFLKAEDVMETYGITASQLKGWCDREKYYRKVIQIGEKAVQSIKVHKAWVHRMLTQLDSLPMDKVDTILSEYEKILQEELVAAKEEVAAKKAEISRIGQMRSEIKNREMECRHTISKTLRGL